MDTAQAINRPASTVQLFLYGMPGLPLAMLGLPLYVFLPAFYAETIGLPLATIGFALLLARSIDVLTDPLIGFVNDKLQGGFIGRRKLFILIGLPILLIGLEKLLRPSGGFGVVADVAGIDGLYLFTWSFITYLGWTLIFIPWQAWGAEISRDYHSKSTLSASREFFAVLGTLIVIGLPALMGLQSQQNVLMDRLASILWLALPLLLIPPLLFLRDRSTIAKADTPNNQSEAGISRNAPEWVRSGDGDDLHRFSKSTLSRKTLKRVLLDYAGLYRQHAGLAALLPAWFLNSLANAFPATLFILFVNHVLQSEEKTGLLLLVYFVSAIIGLPVWLKIARITGKSRAWRYALILSVVCFSAVPLLGSGDVALFLIVCILTGLALGADVALPASIQADIAQDLEAAGKQVTGLLFGVWGLLTKLALALAIGFAFPLLDLAGFDKTQPDSASLIMLAVLYGLFPVLLKLIVIFLIGRLPQGRFKPPRTDSLGTTQGAGGVNSG